MIKQETAERIWTCYREIETSKKLLNDMVAAIINNKNDPHAQHLKDAFGRSRNLQLGIPSGENSHRLFNVTPKLAEAIIISHIASKKAELIEVNEQAKIELDRDDTVG